MLDFFLSLVPLALILILMIGFRWGAARSGVLGWMAAIGLAWWRFGAGPDILGLAQLKSLLLSLDVLLIMWGAYVLYRVTDEAGSIAVLGRTIPRLTRSRGMQALLVGWIFASFLQGLGGFGVPVAVTAPLLIGLGFTPLQAVLIPSMGHAWSVTFGSLGTAFQALRVSSGLSGAVLAGPAALALGLLCFVSGWGAGMAAGARWRAEGLIWRWLLLSAVMGSVMVGLAVAGLWGLASLGASSAGLAVGAWIGRTRRSNEPDAPAEPPLDWRAVAMAFAGYGLLVMLALVVEFVPAVHAWLARPALHFSFPELITAQGFRTAPVERTLELVSHPGMVLFYASGLTYLLYQRRGLLPSNAARRIVENTLKRMTPSSLGIVAMIAMAEVMSHAGMTDRLATGMAQAFGAFFPWVSPWIGGLGAFMTGSNTNSNAVFAALQLKTAQLLHEPVPWILAAQTAGGAFGSVIAPAKLLVGASTAGLAGQEGLVLRRLAGFTLGALLLIGLGLVVSLAIAGL